MKNVLADKYGSEKRWVSWKLETRGGKQTKVPYRPGTNLKASSKDPKTWATYHEAKKHGDKVGIVFTPAQNLLGIDIDHCVAGDTIKHEKEKEIRALLLAADTYTELSPSCKGLHLYLALSAPLALTAHKKAPFEAYTSGRYFTTTGTPFGLLKKIRTVTPEKALELLEITGYPWDSGEASQASQNALKREETASTLDDSALLEKMFNAKNGPEIKALYEGDTSRYGNDDSRADLALLSNLAFWTGRDTSRMERLWLISPLGNRIKTQKRKDYRTRTIEKAIKDCKETYSPKSEHKKKSNDEDKSPAAILLEHIASLPNTELFHDERRDAFIALETGGHREIWACKSSTLRKWLAHTYWKLTGSALGSETINSVLNNLEGQALFEGPEHKLEMRTAWQGQELWYDLGDKLWQAIRITKEGWSIEKMPPILFRRYSHTKEQVLPALSNGDAHLLLECVNVHDPKEKLLLLVYLVSSFIPGFPHPALGVSGPQGSAKSTLSRFLRRTIDPSITEVMGLPGKADELIQLLAHHAFLFFDNVSRITDETSDILCKAITGSGFSKRELYTNDEDIIYTFKRSLGINGINIVGTRPDLLERSLLINLSRIPESERTQEKDLEDKFTENLPLILGGILDTLVKAIRIKPSIDLDYLPRMADFAAWGASIAIALGYSQEEFLSAYRENIARQSQVALDENTVGLVVLSFMDELASKGNPRWNGTPTLFLHELTQHASFIGIDTSRYWPKAPNWLMNRLNEIVVPLKQAGIYVTQTRGDIREITVEKLPDDATDDISA